MTASMIVFSLLLLAILAIARFAHREGVFVRPVPATPRRASPVAPPAVRPSRPAPHLQLLEWNDSPPPLALETAQLRIRDRYIAARFPGVMTGGGDLLRVAKVIEAARLYFDERKFDRAHEILQLAVEVSPREASLRLAQIEIAFLKRDGPRFLEAALALHAALPGCREWREVQRLGIALLPDERFFGTAAAHTARDHYGPWPDMPNWIGASWDLTAEVHAAEFHQAMRRAAGHGIVPHLRTAA